MPISVISASPVPAARASPARSLTASSSGGPAGSGSSTSVGVASMLATRRWNPATEEPCHGSGTPAASVSRCVWQSVKPGTTIAIPNDRVRPRRRGTCGRALADAGALAGPQVRSALRLRWSRARPGATPCRLPRSQ